MEFNIISSPVKKEFYDKLSHKKIEINWNKRPISMKLFLSFLTVDVVECTDHLGHSTGWTQYKNDSIGLVIGGGWVNINGKSVELLDRLQFGKKLSNDYNNYVNPFYLFDIFNDAGKKFFVDYYIADIADLINNQQNSIQRMRLGIIQQEEILKNMLLEHDKLFIKR